MSAEPRVARSSTRRAPRAARRGAGARGSTRRCWYSSSSMAPDYPADIVDRMSRAGQAGSRQSTGSPPCASSSALARLNGREPKKPATRGQRARMHRLDHRRVAEQRPEALRVAPPEDRDERRAARDERADRVVGDVLPALAAVRRGRARPHREHAVQQHHAVRAPRREVAVGGRRDAEVVARAPRRCSARLRGTGRTCGSTANERPIGCPGVGYGSWPTMSTRTSSSGARERAQHAVAARQVRRGRPPSRRGGSRRARRCAERRERARAPSPGR